MCYNLCMHAKSLMFPPCRKVFRKYQSHFMVNPKLFPFVAIRICVCCMRYAFKFSVLGSSPVPWRFCFTTSINIQFGKFNECKMKLGKSVENHINTQKTYSVFPSLEYVFYRNTKKMQQN